MEWYVYVIGAGAAALVGLGFYVRAKMSDVIGYAEMLFEEAFEEMADYVDDAFDDIIEAGKQIADDAKAMADLK